MVDLRVDFSLWVEARLSWRELSAHFHVPEKLPIPTPAGSVDARVGLEAGPDGLRLAVDASYRLPGAPRLWGLEIHPEVELRFRSSVLAGPRLADARAEWDAGVALAGSVAGRFRLGLPSLPGLPLAAVASGDAAGWMTVEFETEVAAGPVSATRLSARLRDVGRVALQFPGLPQPDPPLVVAIDEVAGTFERVDDEWRVTVNGDAAFRFAPRVRVRDVPIHAYLDALVGDATLEGGARCSLELGPDEPTLRIRLEPHDTGVSVDVLGVMADLTRGTASAESLAGLRDVDCRDLTEIGFRLVGLEVALGREAVFGLTLEARLGAMRVPAHLTVSTGELTVGVGRSEHPLLSAADTPLIELPFRVPHLTRQKLGYPNGASAARSAPVDRRAPDHPIWARVGAARRTVYDDHIDALVDAAETITGAASGGTGPVVAQSTTDGWLVRPRDPARPPARSEFQIVTAGIEVDGHGTTDLALVCQIDGRWQVLMARPRLRLDRLHLTLDFQNPRQIRLGAEASLAFDGPDARERTITLGGELAADTIYFSLRQAEAPLEFAGVEVRIARLLIGLGYTRRSFAMAFAGELRLPAGMLDALDTSDEAGVGVRLPAKSKVDFKFELIPVVLGKVVLPVPMFQFDVDLREGSSPPLRDARTCRPHWDGFQFIADGVMRVAIKRVSYSPILGLFAASNSDFDGDVDFGDDRNGVTVIADNVFWAYGLDSYCAILAAPVTGLPFCDNFCVSVRLAGFRVNFNLQRPIPTFSPFALFEVVALASDRYYEVDPRGELADSMRISITDAYVIVPDAVRRIFPNADAVLHRPVERTINLATYVRMLQAVGRVLEPAVAAAAAAYEDPDAATAKLVRAAADLQSGGIGDAVAEFVTALPPELRKIRLDASFGGFEGKAAVLLMDRDGTTEGSEEAAAARARLLEGAEFRDFDSEDLTAVRFPPGDWQFAMGDIRPPLVRALRSPAGQATPPAARLAVGALRKRLSEAVRDRLDRYDGTLVDDALQRSLVGELNQVLRGPSFHTGARFRELELDGHALALLGRDRTEEESIRLNRLLVEALIRGGVRRSTGVLVGARIRLLPGQRFRFVGYLYDDGSFSLVTRSGGNALELRIAGMDRALILDVDQRIELTGRARRDGLHADVRAVGSAYWAAADGAIALTLGKLPDAKGSLADPVSLRLRTAGRFRLQGPVAVVAFGDLVRGEGRVDVSETHLLVDALRLTLTLHHLLLEIHPGRGKIGPGSSFRVEGEASLTLFGHPVGHGSARLHPGGAAFEADVELTHWPGLASPGAGGFALAASIEGEVEVGRPTGPRGRLTGTGILSVPRFGVSIHGGISADLGAEETRLRVDGRLQVRGRTWLGGYVDVVSPATSGSVADASLLVGGHVTFEVPVTPSAISGALEITSVVLSGSFDCALEFDANSLRRWRITGAFGLAVRPATGSPVYLATAHLPTSETQADAEGYVAAGGLPPLFEAREYPVLPVPPRQLRSTGAVTISAASIVAAVAGDETVQRGYTLVDAPVPTVFLPAVGIKWEQDRLRVYVGDTVADL